MCRHLRIAALIERSCSCSVELVVNLRNGWRCGIFGFFTVGFSVYARDSEEIKARRLQLFRIVRRGEQFCSWTVAEKSFCGHVCLPAG